MAPLPAPFALGAARGGFELLDGIFGSTGLRKGECVHGVPFDVDPLETRLRLHRLVGECKRVGHSRVGRECRPQELCKHPEVGVVDTRRHTRSVVDGNTGLVEAAERAERAHGGSDRLELAPPVTELDEQLASSCAAS